MIIYDNFSSSETMPKNGNSLQYLSLFNSFYVAAISITSFSFSVITNIPRCESLRSISGLTPVISLASFCAEGNSLHIQQRGALQRKILQKTKREPLCADGFLPALMDKSEKLFWLSKVRIVKDGSNILV